MSENDSIAIAVADEKPGEFEVPGDVKVEKVVAAPEMPGTSKQGDKRSDLRAMTNRVCITIYGYIRDLKAAGHNSLGNVLFHEMLKMTAAANLASESIGKERFFENLEEGFYSSGRLLVYLEFAGSTGVDNNLREAIVESVTGIHKIFAASVKTVKSKTPGLAGAQMI